MRAQAEKRNNSLLFRKCRNGKRNDPSKMRYTVEKLAEIKGVTFEEMARITLENAKRVYNIE